MPYTMIMLQAGKEMTNGNVSSTGYMEIVRYATKLMLAIRLEDIVRQAVGVVHTEVHR
jgi:hypothetical protein